MAPNNVSENTEPHFSMPTWINEDYFLPILDKNMPEFAKIISFKALAATQPGENYCSIMIRVKMDIELKDASTKAISYILKTCLLADKSAALIASMNFFPKEIEIYQNVLPNLERLYQEIGQNIELAPKCILAEEHPERFNLIFEDLGQRKFKNIDRLQGFDMQHMTHVLRKLAEMHAASAVYYELNGAYSEMFNNSFYSKENQAMFTALSQIREPVYEKAMLDWQLEDVEYYLNKKPSADLYFDAVLKLNVIDANAFNVLNHGDCWSNNIMIQYKDASEQQIENVLFVDFQICKWGSPAHDLWYLIVCSAAHDIRVKQFDHFISIYHEHLVRCLKKLNYSKNIPSLKTLHGMMLDYGFWGYAVANTILCATSLPSDKDANMENLIKPGPEADEIRYRTFSNPIYGKAMRQLMPFFDQKGILDIPYEK